MSSKRVIVSMKRFIGDSVMAVPMINAVEEVHPDITIICSNPVAQVLWSPTNERKFLPLDNKRKPWEVVKTALALRKERYDIGILVNHSFRSAATLRLAGIRKLIGHATEGRNWLLSDAISYDESQFEAWSMIDLARPLGLNPPLLRPTLPVTDAERARGVEVLQGATIGLQPGATFVAKTLPAETLAEVGAELQRRGHKLALFGAAAEKESAERLQALLPEPALNLLGATSIRESLGALTQLERLIGADTGLMHMAACVGCPTVTVFGPTPAVKWGHTYGPHKVIQAPDGDIARATPESILAVLE